MTNKTSVTYVGNAFISNGILSATTRPFAKVRFEKRSHSDRPIHVFQRKNDHYWQQVKLGKLIKPIKL